ncbi:poliovirus receptor [Carlito syrichta]|uniref:Poliovirus receptor n=1 Tax=Carlito syrichta TaxID=1868482 RepID=A0A1U7T2B6_CARSF|nr:poliovirus receptor [Carlito syrichta]
MEEKFSDYNTAQPQNTAEAQAVPLSPAAGEPVPVARCVSTEGHPPARITWLSHAGTMANTSQTTVVPGSLSGTATVISLLTLVPSSEVDGKIVTCRVEHESFKEPVLLPVTLAVSYPPEVSISGYDDNWYLGRGEATLTCNVRSNPEPTGYDWSTPTGPLPPSAVAQGARLLISTIDESINTTFICKVTNALGTRQAEETILVTEKPSREQSHIGISTQTIILLILGILALLALAGALFYFCQLRSSRPDRSHPSANGCVSYSTVNTQDNTSQEPQAKYTR